MWINLSIIWISHSEQLRHSFMVSRQWVAIRTKSEVLNIPASASCPKLLAFLLSPPPPSSLLTLFPHQTLPTCSFFCFDSLFQLLHLMWVLVQIHLFRQAQMVPESVESDPRSGRPAASRTPESAEHVRAAVSRDLRLTVWEPAADLGIPDTTVSEILTQDLGMKCVVEKFILWLLLPEQKEHCAAVAKDLIQTTTNEPDFLKKVITRDEWWIYGYDPETKAPMSQWKSPGSPCPKKAQQSCSKIKAMLTVCFLIGKVLSITSYALPGQAINKKHYLNVLRVFRNAIWRKQPHLWAARDWQLCHNNTPAHTSRLMQSFLVKHQITQVTQPHYSPDLTPWDFCLFPKLKSPLKGKRF